jgi:ubiquinone/menaquinone biosynthesis C-methylase UbiE
MSEGKGSNMKNGTGSQSNMVNARLSQDRVRKLYDGLSRYYVRWGELTESRARKRGLELAQIRDGERVLEVAVGTGAILADVARLNPDGFNAGIDISEGMLQKAREKLDRYETCVELKLGSAFEIPYPAEDFDLITNGFMFDLMPFESMPAILAEFWRVLKPGGRVVLTNMTIGERPGASIFQTLYRLSPALMGGCRGVRMVGPLEEAGFQVVTREYCEQFFFPTEVILAKKGTI